MRIYIENNDDCEKFAWQLIEFENELFIPSFPNEDEREPFENIVFRIKNDSFPKTKIILEATDSNVIGGVVTDYLTDYIAQPIYLVVRKEYRRHGIGRSLFEESVEDCKYVFVEVDNPETVKASDSAIDPRIRKEMYERWGFRQVPINYV